MPVNVMWPGPQGILAFLSRGVTLIRMLATSRMRNCVVSCLLGRFGTLLNAA
jgi:hypothetical protein